MQRNEELITRKRSYYTNHSDQELVALFRERNKDVFVTPTLERQALFLVTEVAEVVDAILRSTGNEERGSAKQIDIAGEISDCLFMLYSISELLGINAGVHLCIQKLEKRCSSARLD